MTTRPSSRITELDGVRALAIAAVLCFHYQGFAGFFGGILQLGWAGVDVFFVLSGYLITRILLGMRAQANPYKTFYSRRAVRILPPYVAVQILIVIVGLVLGERAVFTPRYLASQVLFLQGFARVQLAYLVHLVTHPAQYLHFAANFAASYPLPSAPTGLAPAIDAPSISFWSLSVEEYFYLLWAPIVLTLSRRSVAVLGVAVCVVSMGLRLLAPPQAVSYFGFLLRWDAMMYGALLALLFEYWRERGGAPARPAGLIALFAASLAVLVALGWVLHPVLGHDIRASSLFCAFGLPAVACATAAVVGMLILRANSGWWLARLLRTRPLQFVGTISYTMYLLHLLVALVVESGLRRLLPGFAAGSHFLFAVALLSTGLTVLGAWGSWHVLEKPLLRWKDRHIATPRAPAEPALR